MAQHDYINKKPSKRKNNKANAKRSHFPAVLSIIALILVSGFGYGLWYIKQHADPEQVQIAQNPHKSETIEAPKPKPRPPEFIEKLKTHEVKVEVKEVKSGGPYQMQCGSFRTYQQAEEMKAKMAFSGLIAEIRRTEGKNGVWYRVRLGPYERKRQAESDKNKLKRINIVGCGIWGWT